MTSYQNKWFVLLVILAALVAFLICKKVLAPRNAEAQVTSSSTPQLAYQIPVSTLEQKLLKDFPKRMLAIAKCESNLRQFNEDGTTVISPTMDVGIFQLNLKAHLRYSQKMGLDIINSEDDNIAYAKYLYDREGERPWVCSRLI